MTAGAQSELEKVAERCAATIKASAPVDGGELRESVRVEPLPKQPGVRISAGGTPETMDGTFDLAKATEYGTSTRPAHLFFWSNADSYQTEFESAVRKGAEEALKEL